MAECGDREWTKESLRAEIRRLEAILKRMEEDEELNLPHRQLDLFD